VLCSRNTDEKCSRASRAGDLNSFPPCDSSPSNSHAKFSDRKLRRSTAASALAHLGLLALWNDFFARVFRLPRLAENYGRNRRSQAFILVFRAAAFRNRHSAPHSSNLWRSRIDLSSHTRQPKGYLARHNLRLLRFSANQPLQVQVVLVRSASLSSSLHLCRICVAPSSCGFCSSQSCIAR